MPQHRISARASAWLTALFFTALTLLGLWTSADYGQPWDEPWEQDILRLNLNQYAAAFGLDTRLAAQSDMPAPASGLIADSDERDHGECAYYAAFWLVTDESMPALTRMALWHGYTWLWFMAGAAALWCVCRRLGLPRLAAGVAVLLLVLSPRMFAEGHYNNKDVVLLSLVLLTLWQALRVLERPTAARAALFSLAGAAAANTKVIGLFVWGLCALAVLARRLAGRRMDGRAWRAAVTALVAFAGFYALLTPALWADPAGFLKYGLLNAASFARWQNDVLFRGAVYHLKTVDLPRSYLPYMIAVTTPLWILALIAAGQAFAAGRIVKRNAGPLADDASTGLLLCTLLWAVPLGYGIFGRPNIYNGWRHFYFIYGPMLALGGYGFHRLWQALERRKRRRPRRAAALALALCVGWTGAGLVRAHPNQYAYYNVLTAGRDLPAYLELDYWNVSVLQTLQTLLAGMPAGETATVTGGEYWSQHGLESAHALLPAADQARLRVLPQASRGARYVLENSTYAVLGYWRAEAGMQGVARTEGYGQVLSQVYERADR